ncbi:MAG: ADYC domain-containing protein, partial [Kofleriaceae bacterium]
VCGAGGNSPKIDHMGSHDFSTNFGEPNAAGFRLVSAEKSGRPQKIAVVGASLIVTDVQNGTVLTGNAVAGTTLKAINDINGVKYVIRFSDTGTANYYGQPGGATKISMTYLIEWAVDGKPNPEWENICESPPLDTGGNMNRFHVVVFEGDRIVAAQKSVSKLPELQWFNVGCAGHALAKLHLNGYTYGAQKQTLTDLVASRFVSTWQERQAFVRMITADYCGTGNANTIADQPLGYGDARHYRAWPTSKLESRWDENGATCLNKPRIDANPSAEGIAFFQKHILADIKAECLAVGKVLPACPGTSATPFSELWISTNP